MNERRHGWAPIALGFCYLLGCGADVDTQTAAPPAVVTPRASTYTRELKGGHLHRAGHIPLPGGRSLLAAEVLPALKSQLRATLAGLTDEELTLVSQRVEPTPSGAALTHVSYRQVLGGLPIHGTHLNVTLRDDGHGGGQLRSSSYHLYQQPRVDLQDRLGEARAGELARLALRASPDAALARVEAGIRALHGALQRVWDIRVAGRNERAVVIASGPAAGRVVLVDDRVFEIPGSVSGFTVSGGAPGAPDSPPVSVRLPHAQVSGGGVTVSADAAGGFSIDVPAGTPLAARLTGRAVSVDNLAGAALVVNGAAAAGMSLQFSSAGGGELQLSQTTTYRYVDATRTFLEENGLAPGDLGGPLTAHVNMPDVCNAYYDPGAINIAFFQSGGGCYNSAIDSVIAHEYGHFVDDRFGGILDPGLSEGWGDTLACLLLRTPGIGLGLTDGDAFARTCDNDYVYPPGGDDEQHSLGQAWSGFVWHARANLAATLGEEGADALARALVLPSFPSNAPDIPAAVREVFLRDDTDGDLSNQTPHWDALWASAERHGLTFALESDDTPPGRIADLSIVDVGSASAVLGFTAPGDDDFAGTATRYEIRWSLFPLDDGNFAEATPLAAPAPAPGGAWQTAFVGLPRGTTVHVAMRAVDDVGNIGLVSNDVEITTEAGGAVYSESFENGQGGWTTRGLWHLTERRASDGGRAFWYGREATGNYDTGATHDGALVSPVIDLRGVTGATLSVDQHLDIEAESVFDRPEITVTDVDDPTHTLLFVKTTSWTDGAFAPRVESISEFDGRRVTLTFYFDTLDEILNDTEGWYLDRVRILGDGGTSCEHDTCELGGPLDPSCDLCVGSVCAEDPYCCEQAWDEVCISEVETICGVSCP